jgi:hypothetical protein
MVLHPGFIFVVHEFGAVALGRRQHDMGARGL